MSEQKPFEIKTEFEGLSKRWVINESLNDFRGGTVQHSMAQYIDAANKEIERLRAELAEKTGDYDWTPITSVEQMERLPLGYYLVEKRSGGFRIAFQSF